MADNARILTPFTFMGARPPIPGNQVDTEVTPVATPDPEEVIANTKEPERAETEVAEATHQKSAAKD